jgi:hypothetical protein
VPNAIDHPAPALPTNELEERRLAGAKKQIRAFSDKLEGAMDAGAAMIEAEDVIRSRIESFGINGANDQFLHGPGIVLGFGARRLIDAGCSIDEVMGILEQISRLPMDHVDWQPTVDVTHLAAFHHCGIIRMVNGELVAGVDCTDACERGTRDNDVLARQSRDIARSEQAIRCLYFGFQEVFFALMLGVSVPDGANENHPVLVDAKTRALGYIRFILDLYATSIPA